MTLTIEEIQNQISSLQKTLDEMKSLKMEILRNFTGQYFKPHQGNQYRRMESNYIPIWEIFIRSEWKVLDEKRSEELETIFIRDCVTGTEESSNLDKKKNDTSIIL